MLESFENMEQDLEDVKQALLTWGFREDEIQYIVEDEMNMPDFDNDEYP